MLDIFINSQRSPATRRNYAYDLGKWFDFLGDRTPDPRLALAFRSYLELNMAAASAARIFNTCRAYYRWLKGENPFDGIKSTKTVRNRAPRVPSDQDVHDMLARCGDLRDRAVLLLLLNGLRSDEVTRLAREDFKWVEEYRTFILRVVGKGEKERMVPTILETAEVVSAYLSIRKDASTWLAVAPEGKRMTTRQVQYIVEKWSGNTLRPHALRHFYATRILRRTKNLMAVRDLLGHADIQTTQVYTHLDLADLIETTRQAEPVQYEGPNENVIPFDLHVRIDEEGKEARRRKVV